MVEEIYLVGPEPPADGEGARGRASRPSARPATTTPQMVAEYKPKVAAFEAYEKTLDDKQKAWEDGLRDQKPTAWTTLEVHRPTRSRAAGDAKPARR